jgi:hypothetical protein
MIKYFFFFLFIYFLSCFEKSYAQSAADSVAETEETDSLVSQTGDSVETMEINRYSLYRLRAHSGFMLKDSVRQVDSKQLRSYTLNPDYAYANDSSYWQKRLPQKPGAFSRILSSSVLRWIFLSVMVGLVLFGIYQLARENNFSWLSRRGKITNSGHSSVLLDEEMNFGTVIHQYEAEGNYRMAVRYLYLQLIHVARETGGIQFKDSSTNAEIALAFGDHPQTGEFRFLSRAYEYIFYGGYFLKSELYNSLKTRFSLFQKSVSA